jgi:CTP:molybdopterin cytidylyltransferase MocA
VTRSAARNGHTVACVLLAAGGSTRLGRPKQLIRHRGRPLLLHAVAAARGAMPAAPLIVVVGANALRVRAVLQRARCGAHVVANSRWREGMSTSLRVGLAAVPRTARAVLVLLVDQPRVGTAALARLLAAWRRWPGVPAAARYDGRVGVPAVLPRRRWGALKALRGDQGARALLRGTELPTLVDLPEAALDVDTPADIDALRGAATPAQPAGLVAQLTQAVAPLA